MRRIDDRRFKGLPLGACLPVSRIGHLGWNALRDLEYPVLLLHQKQPGHNITTMADYGRASAWRRRSTSPSTCASFDRSDRSRAEGGGPFSRRPSATGQRRW
jgi:hypothetical protein